VDSILEKAKKVAEEAEVFMVSSEDTPVQFEANRLKYIQSKQSTSIALRIIKNGKIGYATTTSLEDGQKLVDMAVETSRFGMKAEFEFPGRTDFPRPDTYDPATEAVPVETMSRLGEEMITAVREGTPDLLCEGGVSKGTTSVRIINSRGGQAEYKQTFFGINIEGELVHDTDMLFVGDGQSSCQPILDVSEIVSEVRKQLELARNRASAPSKLLPVIFTPHGVASGLISPLMAAFNGKTVLEGASPSARQWS